MKTKKENQKMKKRIKVEIEKSTAKAHLVKSRIEPEKTCDVIRLDKTELEIYTGAGWKMAAFDDGRLAKLVDLVLTSPQEAVI